MKATKRFSTVALAATLALGMGLAARAATFVKDVMLIGGTKTEVNNLKTNLTAQGWTFIDYDLNKGCGSSSDYIYLLYKAGNTPGGNSCYGYVSGFYIKSGASGVNDTLSYGGKTYYLTPYDGGSHFKGQKGDLNSNAGGAAIHLYYTKDAFSPERAVNSIWFNDTQSGAVGENGGSTGFDLNDECGGNTAYIYMHYSTDGASSTIDVSKLDVSKFARQQFTAANGMVLTGTLCTDNYMRIAEGATVTFSNMTVAVNSQSWQVPGVWCLGDAHIVLAGVNSVTSGKECGIHIPSGNSLLIDGSGTLDVVAGYGPGIGAEGANQSSCGNITIDGGTVTVTKGNNADYSIGPCNSGSCGTIKIGNVTTGPIRQNPVTYSSTDTTSYTISFNGNGGSGTTSAIVSRRNTPKQIPANGFTRAGYSFVEWNSAANGSGTSYVVGEWVLPWNTTIYAKWSCLTYTIGYTLNSGTLPSGYPTSYNVESAVTLVNPTRDYYNFAGWTGTGLPSSPQTSVTIARGSTGNRTYTAHWTPVTYNISYNLAGGTLPSGHPTTYNVESANFTLVNPTRTGYTFAGWTGSNGSTPQISVSIARGSTGDRTYTANWSVNQYTATFNANGGTGGTSKKQNYGTALTAPTVTRTGYTFTGWSPAVPSTMPAANTTYTAQWSINQYTATFDANGGTGGTSKSQDYGTPLTAPTVTREGYAFSGWSPSVPSTMPAVNTTYTAQWTINQYTATFDANGGSGGTSKSQDYGTALTAPTVAREGYTFAGWTPSVPDSMPAENRTYTAQWTPVTYAVRFDSNGARGYMPDQTFAYDVAQNLSSNAFERTGYLFAGWSDSADGAVLYADGASVSNLAATAGAVVTLHAVWNQTPWKALQERLDQGGTVVLADDVAATAVDETLTITNAVTLDLAGHTLTGDGYNTILFVQGGDLTLTNSVEGAGAVTGGSLGVAVGYGGAFTMNGGAISGNTSESSGGGVCVYDASTFTMNGGAISGNTAYNYGGGVYVDDGGTFAMAGGTISSNTAYEGGGVYVDWGGAFAMAGGAISGNDANDGGGVCVDGGGAFTMAGGTISGNDAGGVYVNSGVFTMTGGTISGNGAGGVVMQDGVLTVSGSPVVSGNTNSVGAASNVCLADGMTLVVDGLSAGASIGVTTETVPTAGHPVAVTSGAAAGDDRYFSSDSSDFFVGMANGEVCLALPMTWENLQDALDAGGTVTLLNDVAAAAGDASLVVSGAVLLDLNGCTITGNGDNEVVSIDDGGDLTLTNSVPSSGAITGGDSGVIVYRGGAFTMNGGAVSGNTADDYGGGVSMAGGTFTMNGGTISGNTSYEYGGGVYVGSDGVFTMNGGEITVNTVDDEGGGVFVDYDGTFTMTGGAISGNTAGWYAGGVECYASFTMTGGTITGNCSLYGGGAELCEGVMTVSGNPVISGNTNFVGEASNVFLEPGKVLTVGGLSAGASIGVVIIDNPGVFDTLAVTEGAAAGDSRYFSSDSPGIVVDERNGEVCFTAPRTPWQALQAQLDQGGTVTLANDFSAQAYDLSLEVTNTVLLDLAGHTLTGNRYRPVICVYEGGSLTLTNSVEGQGSITGGYNGVVVEDGAFTMNGGAVSGNSDSGVFVMEGSFTLNGGTVSVNSAEYGGGVCVADYGTFTMNGGTISDNSADIGGGVYVYRTGTFTMNGGIISDNSANGGGVFVYANGSFTVSGNPVVSGNTNSVGEASNVCLPDGVVIVVDGLSAGASIGVSTETVPTAGLSVVLTSGAAAGDDRCFSSDDPGCFVGMAKGEVCLASPMTWQDLQDALDAGGDVTLLNDVVAASVDDALDVTNSVTLDLNGHTITGNGVEQVFYIKRGGDLTLTNGVEGAGAITGGGYGGVFVDEGGTFTMNGGAISGNSSSSCGGGVRVCDDGTFTMNGGAISDNRAEYDGGGVYLESGSAFTMNGGVISGNVALYDSAGGVFVDWDAPFTMNGGTVSGNQAEYGGGVYVYPYGTFTMNGGAVSGNTADYEGGGVCVAENGAFTMNGGAVSGNTADYVGGGVASDGAFTMTGGTVSGNTACYGGGVRVSSYGAFTMTGSPVISGNTGSLVSSHNVYMDGTLTVSNLTAGASIGVGTSTRPDWGSPVTFTSGAAADDEDCFFSDDPAFSVDVGDGGELCLTRVREDAWTLLQAQLDAGGAVTLANDVAAPSDQTPSLVVTNAVTLDLAGHTIAGSFGDSVFRIGAGGVLTITNSVEGVGAVTGGYNRFGGGVYVGSNGVFRLQGGAISGNRAYSGGGVSVDEFGVFTMTGGAISGNQAEGGGGVSVYGDSDDCLCPGVFTMSGGTISGNVAYDGFGGGMYMEGNAVVTLTGGEISGNAAVAWGEYGGVAVFSSAFTVSGNPVVSGNTNDVGEASNVYIWNGMTIFVDGLSAGASIGVSTATGPTALHPVVLTSGAAAGDDRYFSSDDPDCFVAMLNGEVSLAAPMTWEDLQDALYAGGTVTLLNDVAAGEGYYPLFVTDGVLLDLNGHTITGDGGAPVIVIEQGGDLTLTNSVPETGAITGGYCGVVVDEFCTFTMNGGAISGNGGYEMGGVGVVNNGVFTMNGGAISGNSGEDLGGVFVGYGGTFTMNGGAISGNQAGYCGGGVYVSECGVFTMNDGAITGNTASSGGGVGVGDGGEFTMNDGMISANTAEEYGGGVFVDQRGMFSMTNGTISVNTAGESGGGVYVDGEDAFTMSGGTISANIAWESGGGVFVNQYGAATMTDGAISGNTAYDEGGGVFVYGAFTMTGGAISSNVASFYGGGAACAGSFTMAGGTIIGNGSEIGGGVDMYGTAMTVSGSPVISGNTNFVGEANNVYLEEGNVLTVEGLSAGASIGVVVIDNQGVFNTLAVTEGAAAGDSRYFSSDTPGIIVEERGGEVCFTAPYTPWQALQAQLDQGGAVTLTNDLSAQAYDSSLMVTNTILLDLAGHTLTGNGRLPVIWVSEGGALTLTNSVEGLGSITGGYDGVIVENGVFTMNGGAISGNTASNSGGVGVANGGTFTMNGGTISDNGSADACGGGVLVYGATFTMNGGAITGNQAGDGGGGVVVAAGVFTMNGGAITGNQGGSSCGGGVYVTESGAFTMEGGAISGNTASSGGGVYVYQDSAFTMNGGEITGNVALGGGDTMVRGGGGASASRGGGVFALGTFEVSGTPVVSGNTNAVGEASNVYLPGGNTIAVNGLSAGASIGVSTEYEPEDGYPVAISADATTDDAAYFFSDDPGCHVEMVNGELCLVAGVGLPAYLVGADDLVIANYAAWAAKYGPDTAGTHRDAFLLDIDPATPIPPGAALLKIVEFRFTATSMYIELASDVTQFEENGTGMLGNGFLAFRSALSLSPDPDDWETVGPFPVVFRNGHAIYSYDDQEINGENSVPLDEEVGAPLEGEIGLEPEDPMPRPSSFFFKAILTDRVNTVVY